MASSSSSPPPAQPYPGSSYYLWNRIPAIQLVVPRKEAESSQTDERCFTFCSQTARGRRDNSEPYCRTFCIRRVFQHEVRRTLNAHNYYPMHKKHNITPNASNEDPVEVDAKYPLPPEGQKRGGLFGWSRLENMEKDENVMSLPGDGRQAADMKYWKEGWYLWIGKSRWVAQEKLDLMMLDLERQSEWQRYKDQVNSEWEAHERSMQRGEGSSGQFSLDDQTMDPNPTQNHSEPPPSVSEPPPPPGPPPFIDAASNSVLLPIPGDLPPINDYVRNLLAPTWKLLSLTDESIQTGAQRKFAERIWEKAGTNEPFTLARNVCRVVWKSWKNEGEEDQGNQDKGKDS